MRRWRSCELQATSCELQAISEEASAKYDTTYVFAYSS